MVAGVDTFPPGEAPAILVVEDQPMNQMVLRRQLARLGANCDLAENGREALDMLADNRYDIVITDCSMPVMDGFELSRKLRAEELAGRPRSTIIALTANAVSGDAQRCFIAGMDAYLPKPVSLADLATMLKRWYRPTDTVTTVPQGGNDPEVGAEDTAETPINRKALAELLGEDDPEVLDQLVRDFFRCWQGSLAALDRPLDDRNAPSLVEAAHAAKGTARYGAADRLAVGCARLEEAAKAQQWVESAAIVEQLKQDTHHLETFLTTSGLIEDEQLRGT
jgi:CheY-like chemotaxis protein/HPt (histidine-containing phosphotransfer) domain-containing protein